MSFKNELYTELYGVYKYYITVNQENLYFDTAVNQFLK